MSGADGGPGPGRGDLVAALDDALGSRIASLSPVAGGDLNDAFRAETADGELLFVKTAADAQPDGFPAEARGLAWLGAAGGLPTPRVVAVGDADGAPRFLALEWIAPGRPGPSTDEELGRGLAEVHLAGAEAHGGPDDVLRLGPLALPTRRRRTRRRSSSSGGSGR